MASKTERTSQEYIQKLAYCSKRIGEKINPRGDPAIETRINKLMQKAKSECRTLRELTDKCDEILLSQDIMQILPPLQDKPDQEKSSTTSSAKPADSPSSTPTESKSSTGYKTSRKNPYFSRPTQSLVMLPAPISSSNDLQSPSDALQETLRSMSGSASAALPPHSPEDQISSAARRKARIAQSHAQGNMAPLHSSTPTSMSSSAQRPTLVREEVLTHTRPDGQRRSAFGPKPQIGQPLPSEALTKTCGACNKLITDRFRCGTCQAVYYCDAECQRNDWPRHKVEHIKT